jgi:hypothetical protein
MHHRAAVIPAACSVLAQVGPLQAPSGDGRVQWPATIHARLVAARMDSQGVVRGSNGQARRRIIITW